MIDVLLPSKWWFYLQIDNVMVDLSIVLMYILQPLPEHSLDCLNPLPLAPN